MHTKKTLLLLSLSISVFLTACDGASTPATETSKEKQTIIVEQLNPDQIITDADTNETTVEDLQAILQGRWQESQDTNSEVEFRGNERIDYYEGQEVDRGPFSLEKTCAGADPNETGNYIVQGDMCWLIASADQDIISFIYIARGNTIFYSRVDENTNDANSEETQNDTKADDKDKLAIIDTPLKDENITSPVTVAGQAPAFWFFENSFPVQVQDATGTVLGYGQAYPDTEGFSEGMTAFHAEVEFENVPTTTGQLVLMADNPSGLPENAYSVKLPVTF